MEVIATCDDQVEVGTFDYDVQRQGIIDAYIGHKWIHFNLSNWSCDSKFIDIEVKLNTRNGLVGLWIPSSDWTVQKTSSPSFQYVYRTTEDNVYVDRTEWEYGDVGKLRIHNNQPSTQFNINFSALIRPIFEELKNEVEVCLSIFDELKNLVAQKKYILKIGKERERHHKKWNSTNELNFLRQYEAFTFEGGGNIVHPKQHLTLRGFKYILDNYLNENSELTIGYIGTDTTENLRSLIRWLIDSNNISRISEFRIFFTSEWDSDMLEESKFILELKQIMPKFNFRYYELSPHSIDLLKKSSPCHIIVSTFVTPWVQGKSRELYQKLLENSMDEHSYLLSVDPKTGRNSVRSELSFTNINNDNLYKEVMKLRLATMVSHVNNSVEFSIWNKSTAGN